ncbi:MAG: DNA/RNA non-specific endonuclease [Victivallaceae bacterium]
MKKFLLLLCAALTLSGCVQTQFDNLTLGVPGDADIIIDREGYALGYIERHEQAAWVIYKLTAAELKNRVVRRGNNFRGDPEVPSGSADLADYRNSTYDRGHLAPAADMAWSAKTMSESFFMSNISPQLPSFNRGVWAKLEAQVRSFALAEKEIYVVTGPIFPQKVIRSIGENKVTIPTHYYKVIYDLIRFPS